MRVKSKKAFVIIIMLISFFATVSAPDVSAARYHETKLSLYGMNRGGDRNTNIRVDERGKLQVAITNAMDKKEKECDAKLVFNKKGKKESITKIKKGSKKIFVDDITTIAKGKRIYKIKIKGSKAVLSIYNKKSEKIKTQRFDCAKIKAKYKKMKAVQLHYISKNKLRLLYSDTDSSGVSYGGGSAVLNLSTGKAKRESKFSFAPQGYSKEKVYANTGGSICVANVKTGKNVAVFQTPSGGLTSDYNCVSYRNGTVLYVNQNGAYMAKDTDKELKLIYSFENSKFRTKYICCAAVESKKSFYVGFGTSEGEEPSCIVKYFS